MHIHGGDPVQMDSQGLCGGSMVEGERGTDT